MRSFYGSHAIAIISVLGILILYGVQSAFIVMVLAVLEISLSMDNAVMNASVLKNMTPIWQKYFVTWGILIAVIGMRLVFPVVIVAFASELEIYEVMSMIINAPEEYSRHLSEAHTLIASFGGTFLLMVGLSFMLDESRDIYWLERIEKRIQQLGKNDAINTTLALGVLLTINAVVPKPVSLPVLIGGCSGIFLYGIVSSLDSLFSVSDDEQSITKVTQQGGIIAFLYLEILDASFSFDGVIGAFAITDSVPIIMVGLGIGALYVRSMTVYLVKKGTLETYIYLEHGAHYAILTLSGLMLFSLFRSIPEIVTGLSGATFIGLSLLSSVRYNERKAFEQF